MFQKGKFIKSHLTWKLVLIITFAFVMLSYIACDKNDNKVFAQESSSQAVDNNFIDVGRLSEIDALVRKAIEDEIIPGCVVVVGYKNTIFKFTAYGNHTLIPSEISTAADTIYDLASLTKVVATAPSIMILFEQGKLNLSDPVSKYIPEFEQKDKGNVTILQLMTHTSGLAAWRHFRQIIGNVDNRLEKTIQNICEEELRSEPGTEFVYSDLNYVLLAEIVRRISGSTLDEYARTHIFQPLEMTDTLFNPPNSMTDRCATTFIDENGTIIRGFVQDPTARFLFGVTGNAGLFSTAEDISKYCQMLINGGVFNGKRILSPLSIKAMTTNQIQIHGLKRGAGFDISTGYSYPKGDTSNDESFGHTGHTGTCFWIDPKSKVYTVLLSNRLLYDRPLEYRTLVKTVNNITNSSIINVNPWD